MVKKGNTNHVLVIRLSAMGDVAMLVPCILALIKTYPTLKITILTRARFEPLFEGIPNVAVFYADVKNKHKGLLGLYRLYKQLKAHNIDAVADTHNVLRSTILKAFFTLSSTPFIQIDKGRSDKKALTKKQNKVFKPLKTTHQRYADVFEKLGFPIENFTDFTLKKPNLPRQFKVIEGRSIKRIGIAPFAAFKGKMYPLDLMEEVIKKLVKHQEFKIFLFGGGEKEVLTLEAIAQKFGNNLVNLAGKLSFKEELAVIANLDVMLAMDSGNGHLAANYGVPVVTLWGVTHPFAGFAPYGQPKENSLCADRDKFPLIPTSIYGNKFSEGYEKAMETITADRIYNTIVQTVINI